MKIIITIFVILLTSKALAQEPCQEFLDGMSESAEKEHIEAAKFFMKGFLECNEENNTYSKTLENLRSLIYITKFEDDYAIAFTEEGSVIVDKYWNCTPLPFILPKSFSNGRSLVYNDKYGYIDNSGQLVIPCIYENAESFSDGFAAVRKQKKWGFINKKGEMIIPCIYDKVTAFHNGFAEVTKDFKKGVIDKVGKEVIPVIYNDLKLYKDYIIVSKDNYYELINYSGEILTGDKYEIIGDPFYKDIFFGELAFIKRNNKYGYINKEGKEVITAIYEDAKDFQENLGLVKKNEKYGFIDKDGKTILPFIYDIANSFHEDTTIVQLNNKIYLIDKDGRRLLDLTKYGGIFFLNGGFQEGLVSVTLPINDAKFGFIDKFGVEVIPMIYQDARNFNEGLARVQRNNKWGYIDKSGKIIIPIKYDKVQDFSYGLALVEFDGNYFYINNKGELVKKL